ncbi:hypothetical protein AURDEDRAFT_187960 [Auricularia subglabra TFB-10046 SS5]|uniref:Autophagy-related protein 17 n=1 Tax=Auricularia subglabra (strain TFB-10046 / SS5) TaxID=717982 RepID=J0LHS2_AURST|nr:hypothetical protein AURDEDRAFT_187960 [Auricularia subglabra TFB-10046 SS5]
MVDVTPLLEPSERALQDAQALCTDAQDVVHATTRLAVDILALDARVRWVSEGMLEQFKLAAAVAKTLEAQRQRLLDQVKEWDAQRAQHVSALDAVLDACGAQLVPVSFYHTDALADDSDVFRDPDSADHQPHVNGVAKAKQPQKTLRDFIDERAIEDAGDRVDDERNRFDDLLAASMRAQASLEAHVDFLQLPQTDYPEVNPEPALLDQEKHAARMAAHLTALARHYEQVCAAAREGVAAQDAEVLARDTEELPAIVAELRDFAGRILDIQTHLSEQHQTAHANLAALRATQAHLDALEKQLETTLADEDALAGTAADILEHLHAHLDALAALRETYASYRLAYARLVLELDRRARYSAAAEEVVLGALAQLDAMREEEMRDRALFFAEQGAYLPDDLCLYVGAMPPPTELAQGPREELPILDERDVAEARRNVDLSEGRL